MKPRVLWLPELVLHGPGAGQHYPRQQFSWPLSNAVRQKVRTQVLDKAACGGRLLRELCWRSGARADGSGEPELVLDGADARLRWRRAAGGGGLGAYIARQSYVQWKLLNRTCGWCRSRRSCSSLRAAAARNRSMRSFRMDDSDTISMTEDEAESEEDYDADTVLQWPGKFREASVGVRLLQTQRSQERLDISLRSCCSG
uniref:Uncharacterized protein n=1 Tax=Macrostomum lignano TaxID=282301 RepID=A0A1I8FU75_9PLAT